MGKYTILKNSELNVSLEEDYQDNGWRFVNGVAIHDGSNSGSIYNKVFRPVPDSDYIVNIIVSDMSSGGFLEVSMGGVIFGVVTENGEYSFSATVLDDSFLFFTSGENDVTIVSYNLTTGINDGTTLVFDTLNNGYVGEQSLKGEFIDRFMEDSLVYKNGIPWVSDSNSKRNTFFNESYPSVIKFYCNIMYDSDKDFYKLAINGNMPWHVDLSLPAREGKHMGQVSRIKKGNFKFDKGVYVADILRDMNDPRFSDKLQALMRGAHLQGQIMEVTITNDSTSEVELMSVDIYVAIK